MIKTTNSIKQFVEDELDKKGYVTDIELYSNFCAVNLGTVEEYKKRYFRYKSDIVFVKTKQNKGTYIIEKRKSNRKHLIRFKDEDCFYQICKRLYNEILV